MQDLPGRTYQAKRPKLTKLETAWASNYFSKGDRSVKGGNFSNSWNQFIVVYLE